MKGDKSMRKKEKIRLKDIVTYEKTQMLPLNFTMSYIITPIYLGISFLLIAVFAVLMGIDDEKYLVHGLLCLGAFVLITILILASVPFVRKRAIETEIGQYDFNVSKVETFDMWDFSTEEFSLKFDKNGMYVNDELFYYNHLSKMVVTGNYCKRVEIYLQFALSEDQVVTLSVNPTTLKMLEFLEIKLDNQHVLEYIISNKKEAFKQIYNKGFVVVRY